MFGFKLIVTVFICIAGMSTLWPEVDAACGRRQVNLAQLVTHGYTTNPGEFPWHAAIYMTSGFKKTYICGGTLVNEESIITAAHCVTDPATEQIVATNVLYVQLGKFKLNLYSDKVQEHAVQEVIVHGEYQMVTSKYDIAVLKLATQVKFTDFVQPICVYPQPNINYSDENVKGVAVGWGYTEFDSLSDALQGTTMPLISYTKCLESNPDLFDRTLYDGMFCAGRRNGTNLCNGDSGGGLYYNQKNVWYLIGIVSFTAAREVDTHLCSTKDYTGFTKVLAFEEFITHSCNLVTEPDLTPSAPAAGGNKPQVAIPNAGNQGQGDVGKRKIKYYTATNFNADQKLNWYQAIDYCRSNRQHIAEIKNYQDNTKVQDIVIQGGMELDNHGVPRVKQYWIGANDLGLDNYFKWHVSGKPVDFANWRQNEPNDEYGRENCVAVVGNKRAVWLDANCRAKKQVLCEVWK